ncbi:hypothetical protein ACH4S8_43915 [Streptomyces sp. NPDC021080]|uniref:hypothetical protein n=1 Tax=Streptomyces sp. NPDC021080 TaxID=3365110 RepID=UPI003791F7D2
MHALTTLGGVPAGQVRYDNLTPAAKKALGDTKGAKALVKALLLHRHQQHADVVIGIRAALEAGTFNEDVIALEARKAAQAAGRAPTVTPALEPLISPRPRSRL